MHPFTRYWQLFTDSSNQRASVQPRLRVWSVPRTGQGGMELGLAKLGRILCGMARVVLMATPLPPVLISSTSCGLQNLQLVYRSNK